MTLMMVSWSSLVKTGVLVMGLVDTGSLGVLGDQFDKEMRRGDDVSMR